MADLRVAAIHDLPALYAALPDFQTYFTQYAPSETPTLELNRFIWHGGTDDDTLAELAEFGIVSVKQNRNVNTHHLKESS